MLPRAAFFYIVAELNSYNVKPKIVTLEKNMPILNVNYIVLYNLLSRKGLDDL